MIQWLHHEVFPIRKYGRLPMRVHDYDCMYLIIALLNSRYKIKYWSPSMQVGRGQFPHSRAFRSQQPCTGGPLNPLSWTSTRMTNPLLNGRRIMYFLALETFDSNWFRESIWVSHPSYGLAYSVSTPPVIEWSPPIIDWQHRVAVSPPL